MSNPELYLYYSLKIEPFDNEACIIKKNIDLSKIMENHQVLKNEEVKEHFKKEQEFCPLSQESFIDTCYVKYTEQNHTVKILFYKVNNCELLTPNVIFNSTTKNLLTSIHRTINIQNNLLTEYDKYFNSELDNIIKVLSQPRYYNLSEIYVKDSNKLLAQNSKEFSINKLLKIKLFDYQKDNVNWMINFEKNPVEEYISSDKLYFFPDGRIYNYTHNTFVTNEQRELVKFKGGIILDNVGIGKTLQLLCLAMSDPSIKTFILVPNHLELHWNSQFEKHFNIPLPKFIKIVKFSDFASFDTSSYQRVITDEIHELYSNAENATILEKCFKTGCKYKWGISATPFPVPNSIFNIIKYLTEIELYYQNLDRFNYFYNSYYKIFRKNTLENIVKEIQLPEAIEHNLLLDFNDQERIVYDAETQANTNCDEYFLRKCCCDVMINFKNQAQVLTLTEYKDLVVSEYKFKFEKEYAILLKYIQFYNRCIKVLELMDNNNINNVDYMWKNNNFDKLYKMNVKYDIEHNKNIVNSENNEIDNELLEKEIKEIKEIMKNTTKKELIDNINHYKLKIKEQEPIVKNRKLAYDYLNNKINETDKQCPLCMGEIADINDDSSEENLSYDVPECGHIYCSGCLKYWLASNSACSVCMRAIDPNKTYTIKKLKDVKFKYSTKIDEILKILANKPNEKFIIYTQFDNLISKLYQTLVVEGVGCIKLDVPEQIEEFKLNLSKRVLILSSVKNASGLDLSFVSNIVIFDPIIGDTLFLRDIENQIIGRIYRINQIHNINIYRLIIKNSIEETIFNKTLELIKNTSTDNMIQA